MSPGAERASMKKNQLWALILTIYVAGVVAFSAYSYQTARESLLAQVDRQLGLGAVALAKIAGPAFHENLAGPESRSEPELRTLARELTDYSRSAGLIYIYSVIQRNGTPLFAAASVGYDYEWDSGTWNSFFRPYLEPPKELLETFADGKTRFAEYKDEYGSFRSIFVAQRTQKGEIWIAGADVKTDEIEKLLHRSVTRSVLTALYFMLLLVPAGLIYRRINRENRALLEEKVERRTQELAQANQRLREQAGDLERSNRDLEQYAYVASHDLREPLRMVSSYLALVERNLGDNLQGEVKTFIDFAIDGAKRMDVIIRDLLEFSRVGRGEFDLKAVELSKIVEETLFGLKDTLEAAGAKISLAEDLPAVVGSPGEIARLYQNLIGNAIKYRAKDRSLELKIGWSEQDGEKVFWVEDNGIGIEPRHHERAFGIFQRLVPKESCEGTGIGLAICRRIVEHHGGRIWVESEGEDKGSRFSFTLFEGDKQA
jgi:signal transduction histidine kinase